MTLPRALSILVLPVSCGLLLSACGDTVSKSKLEQSIKDQSSQLSPNSPITTVSCPKDITGKTGQKETCVVTLQNGHQYQVDATVSSVSGNTAHFTYNAGKQIK
jgi:hypothetical protein